MSDILSKLFGFLKYILLVVSFGLVFYCLMITYSRLEKPLTEGIDVFVPFAFILLVFLVNLFIRGNAVSKNLLFNFTCVFVFCMTIVICLRAMFDTDMILFYKYGIDFNPAFFSDNLSMIEIMLYILGSVNVLLILCNLIDRDKKKTKEVKKDSEIISSKHVSMQDFDKEDKDNKEKIKKGKSKTKDKESK